jgi:hypothetical protein
VGSNSWLAAHTNAGSIDVKALSAVPFRLETRIHFPRLSGWLLVSIKMALFIFLARTAPTRIISANLH